MSVLFIAFGIILLFWGGELLLKGSISISLTYNISKILVGVLIIGFGTSMPELAVSIGAALKDSSDIILGNIVGSNISNTLLIAGVSGVLSPITIRNSSINRDIYWMWFAVLLLVILSLFNTLNLFTGLLLLLMLAVYICYSLKEDSKNNNNVHAYVEEEATPSRLYRPITAILFILFGFVMLLLGAHLLVKGAIDLARIMGVSETIIGLTVVAVGTSLPEISTALIGIIRKHHDVVIGNILGSNIFNILFILGATSTLHPLQTPSHIVTFDIWVMLVACLYLGVMLIKKIAIDRKAGIFMLSVYVLYVLLLYKFP